MATEKQILQRSRAGFKFRLLGAKGALYPRENLTAIERDILNDIRSKLDDLINMHDDNNKHVFKLNVPEHRCWCSKGATVKDDSSTNIFYCSKHYKEYKEIINSKQ